LKVLIIDDHEVLREGLRSMLLAWNNTIETVEAGKISEVHTCVRSGIDYDLVLLDLNLPGVLGYELLESLVEQLPDTPVVVLSITESASVIQDVLRKGAKGYIPKSSSTDVIKNAISLVLSGSVYIPPSLLDLMTADGNDESSDRIFMERSTNIHRGLTKRQVEIIELLFQGKTNKEISSFLNLSTSTVRSHLTILFRQLNVKNRTEAVSVARDAGLLNAGAV